MPQTPEIERLAKAAAREVEAKILHMLTNGDEGEIIVALGSNAIQVIDRPKRVIWGRKLERGHWAVLERVK